MQQHQQKQESRIRLLDNQKKFTLLRIIRKKRSGKNALNQETWLKRYLDDGHLSIDNLAAERAPKNFAIGSETG